jgi:hypothetical protein
MRIDGRPVMFMYLTREYFKTQSSWQALSAARAAIEQQFGYDPYIIGDDFFGSTPVNIQRAAQFDAITNFDVYGTAFGNGAVNQSRVTALASIYDSAQTAAEAAGVAFVPTASPGFNDRGVRTGHTPAARYLSELGPSAQGSLLSAILEDAVLPYTDPSIGDLFMVNSFNEWHEDTQIEASSISGLTNTDDSPTGSDLTAGRYYGGYGNLYLDILRAATNITGDYNGDGHVDGSDFLTWRGSFGTMGTNLPADGNRNGVVDAADYTLWRNVLTAAGQSGQAVIQVPEPPNTGTALVLGFYVSTWWTGCRRLSRPYFSAPPIDTRHSSKVADTVSA